MRGRLEHGRKKYIEDERAESPRQCAVGSWFIFKKIRVHCSLLSFSPCLPLREDRASDCTPDPDDWVLPIYPVITMREIVHCQVGQCGNQIGSKVRVGWHQGNLKEREREMVCTCGTAVGKRAEPFYPYRPLKRRASLVPMILSFLLMYDIEINSPVNTQGRMRCGSYSGQNCAAGLTSS